MVESTQNYAACERITQEFLDQNPSEEQLRIFVAHLQPTLLQWWKPKMGVLMLLWEHFYKLLNTSFYLVGVAPEHLAVTCNSGRAYLQRYRALLAQLGEQSPLLPQYDANMSSYTLFTLLLGKMLERLLADQQQHNAQKLLGRIYSKFSSKKFQSLNETGIHHVIELFVVLALCGESRDMLPKLRDKLLCITFDKVNLARQQAVAKGHMALLILHAEKHIEFGEYVTKLLAQLVNVRGAFDVYKIFADALYHIISEAEEFGRGEHLLIDNWLPHYLSSCSQAEQERTFEALHLIFVKFDNEKDLYNESYAPLFKSLNDYILPFLMQQYANNYSSWLPQLAADFCMQSKSTDYDAFQRLFMHFIETPTANRQAPLRFLLRLLDMERAAIVTDRIIMQVWLKSLVLLSAQNTDVVMLSKHVVRLPLWHTLCGISEAELLTSSEPLTLFIADVGKQYEHNAENYKRRCQIADQFNALLDKFERWLPADACINQQTELYFRYYSFIALVVYNCAKIVYVKSKITCFFHIAMTRFMLPTSIQMGKPPEPKFAQLMHKVWPVLVQGIGHLSYKTDTYIGKTLSDLIQKWIPHLRISLNTRLVARPFVTCLKAENYDLTLFVCEKLTNMFLSTQRRQADVNACLIVTLFQEAINAINGDLTADVSIAERRLATLMQGTCLKMLEHIMLVDEVVPSRGMLLDLFRRLTHCQVYKNAAHLHTLLANELRVLTRKHLAYHTFFFFELLQRLTQISASLVSDIWDTLLDEVRIVEGKRAVGEDQHLRACLKRLQQAVTQQ